jgi:hypothetical protein
LHKFEIKLTTRIGINLLSKLLNVFLLELIFVVFLLELIFIYFSFHPASPKPLILRGFTSPPATIIPTLTRHVYKFNLLFYSLVLVQPLLLRISLEENYENLSQVIYKKLNNGVKPTGNIRCSIIWFMLTKTWSTSFLQKVADSILLPKQSLVFPQLDSDRKLLPRQFTGPLLRAIRGEQTLDEVFPLVGAKSAAGYHYWEKGSRDMPFASFLKLIDVVSHKLGDFCALLDVRPDWSTLQFVPPSFLSDPVSQALFKAAKEFVSKVTMSDASHELIQLAKAVEACELAQPSSKLLAEPTPAADAADATTTEPH